MAEPLIISEQTEYDPEAGRYDELYATLKLHEDWNHDPARLQAMIDDPEVRFMLGKAGGLTVAMATIIAPIPTGTKTLGLVEDVAVLPEAQGNGYGKAMMHHIQGVAEGLGVDTIQLTSNPDSRPEANRMYRDLGYRYHNTNVFVMDLGEQG